MGENEREEDVMEEEEVSVDESDGKMRVATQQIAGRTEKLAVDALRQGADGAYVMELLRDKSEPPRPEEA